jgi:hypothetical protein
MNVEALCRRVTQFGFILLGADFAMDARQHSVEWLSATRKSVMWARDSLNSLMVENPSHVGDYLSILEKREYSYLMRDGGVLQIAFVFDRGQIERHRLLYFPCPFRITRHDLNAFNGGLLDLIQDAFMDELDEKLLLRSPIRFDYVPNAGTDFHPASHLTLNDPSCRIPARAPLRFDTFMKFVLENFYIEAWQHPPIARALAFSQEAECLSEHDKRRAYLHWEHPA